MLKHLTTLSCLTLLLLAGCKKEMAPQLQNTTGDEMLRSYAAVSDAAISGTVDTSVHWVGGYAGYDNPYPSVPDSLMIKNGGAKLPSIPKAFLYSNVSLYLPENHAVNGDSLVFEVSVRNTGASGFYNYDIVLQIVGDEHAAELHFVGDAGSQQYNQFYVGDARVGNIPQLNKVFDSLKTVRLILKENNATAYVDDQLIYKLAYGVNNRIGNVSLINVAGKGFAVVNKVRLLNSYTRARILLEDFNTNGKSNTVFF